MKHYREDQPWLPFDAIKWLETVLNENMRVFEWGAGGSTIWLAQRCLSVVTVEIDREWLDRIDQRAKALHLSNIRAYLLDPFDRSYSHVIALQPQMFDLIFIDGKARGLCAEEAKQKVAKGGMILFDNSDAKAHEKDIEPLVTTGWPVTKISSDGVGGHWECSVWRNV